MKPPAVLALFSVLLLTSSARPDDTLSKIERRIAKEPVYTSKFPQYCLLVFGPKAETQVWFVFDEDVIYLDRNGDGDLTGADERVEVSKSKQYDLPDSLFCGQRWFYLGDINSATGKKVYRDVTVRQLVRKKNFVPQSEEAAKEQRELDKFPHQPGANIMIEVAENLRQDGGPIFGGRAQDAPILHFDGPLTMCLWSDPVLKDTGKEEEFYVCLGSTGQGESAITYREHGDIATSVHPIAEFEFANKKAGGEPIRLKLTLDRRC